ncbi:MAG: phage tail tape measure protein, partial [Planctomycetes bacterium]|nr:phage tail tape measure protein [Planctomycetota bacterium]
LGFGGSESRQLSQRLESLALDFASFNNITDEDAIGRFIAALSGSGEVLDRFGINIKQAALEQELLAMGIRKSWTEVTEQEKALARLNVIARAMGDQGAIGDAVKTAGSFTNQMKRLRGQVHDTAVEIGNALLPIVTPLVAKVADLAKRISAWVSQNQHLVASVFKIAAAVAAAGAALVVLGVTISSIGTVLGVVAGAFSMLGTVLGAVVSAVGVLLSPLGILLGAVAALGVYLVHSSGIGGKAIDWLKEKFASLKEIGSTAVQAIGRALASGDIGLAMTVLWASIKLVWEQGIVGLRRKVAEFKNWILVKWEQLGHGVTQAFLHAMFALKRAWNDFQTWHSRKVLDWGGAFAKAAIRVQAAFDDTIDVQFAMSAIDSEVARQRREIEGGHDARERELDDQHRQALALAEQEHQKVLADIDEQSQARIAAAEGALQAARAEWEQAIADVGLDTGGGGETDDGSAPPRAEALPDIRNLLAGISGELGSAAEKIGAKGTFNAAALAGLQAGDATAKTNDLLTQIERNTHPIRNATGPTFSAE